MQSQQSGASAILIPFVCAEASKLLLWHHGIYNLLIYAAEHSLDSFSASLDSHTSTVNGGEAVRVSGAECSSLILMKRGEPAHGARAGSLSYLLSSLGSADDVLEHYAARGSRI